MPQALPAARFLHDLSFPALERELAASGVKPIHARALWRALYRERATDLTFRPDFLAPLRQWLDTSLTSGWTLDTPEVVSDLKSSDGQTRKFLLRLSDGQTVETVIMGYPGRYTACLSTQAGCAMGCTFCATGQMGFIRHLRPGEIVAQVLHCERAFQAEGSPGLRNIVLMGMGEPLHNYDAVMTALEIITERRGINLAPSHISVSTVGVIPGIQRLAAENRPYNLAVSLHAATDAERASVVPITRRWPLAELIAACRSYGEKTGRRIFFGWTLIDGKNDTPAVARQLAALLTGLDAHINLIPLNPTDHYPGQAGTATAAETFKSILQEAGFPCTLRQRRGLDVAAGCGQLRAAQTSERPTPGTATIS